MSSPLDVAENIGRYSVVRKIGSGGMAEVFLALAMGAQGTQKQLVIKKIHPALARSSRFTEMFVDEARVAMRLNHSNIVQVYTFEQLEDGLVLAMEHVDGPNLLELQQAARRADTRFPWGVSAFIVQEVAKGLDYAHSRRDDRGEPLDIVHRDVSPQNVLISREGAVKITDFGIARARWFHDESTEGLKGKLGYMAPEQAAGRPVDRRSDIFSLGVVLHELLVGVPLMVVGAPEETLPVVQEGRHPSPRELDHEVPFALDEVVRRAMATGADERFRTAREMAQELGLFLHSLPEIYDGQALEAVITELVPPDGEAFEDDAAVGDSSEVPVDVALDTQSDPAQGLGEVEHRPVMQVVTAIEIEPHPDREAIRSEVLRLAGEMAYKADGVLVDERAGFRIYLGLPHSSMEDAIRGIRLGYDVADAIRALSRDHRLEIRARIAVNRGEVSCRRDASGAVPAFDPERLLVTIADHLVGAAGPGEILAGGGAFRLARREYNFGEPRNIIIAGEEIDEHGPRELKGYPVLRAKSRAERSREEQTPGVFLGRRAELDRLRRCYERASAGGPVLVRVTGEMGIGKSRLVTRFVNGLDPGAHHSVKVECLFAERDTPLAVAAATIRAVLELGEREIGDDLLDEPLDKLLGGAPRYLVRQTEFLGEFLSAPETAWTRSRGRQRRLIRKVAFALGVLLARIAVDRPLILVVENAHWLDGQSIDVLSELSLAGLNPRMLVLLVGQPSTLAGRRIPGGVESLEVTELPDDALRGLVAERLGTDEEMAVIAEQILARAQGNPFFVSEIIESLIERGIIAEIADARGQLRYRQARPGAIRLPTTMEGLAAGHIDDLEPSLRTTLRAASAVGADFTQKTVSGLAGRDVSDDLGQLVQRGFLVEISSAPGDDGNYRFRRAMVREASYRGLSGRDRQRIHRMLAEQLIAELEAGGEISAAQIAWQLDRAGDAERAAGYYLAAGDAAMRVYSSRQALKLYDRAIPLLPEGTDFRFDAVARREKVLRALGRHRERGPDIEQLGTIALALGDDSRVATASLRRAQLGYDRGDFMDAAQALGTAIELAGRTGDRFAQIEALRLLAYVATESGHLIRALDTCERALALIPQDRQGPYLRGRVLGVKGFVMLNLGYLGTAPEVLAEALVLFRTLGKRRNESTALSNLALTAQARGELYEAVHFLQSAMRVDREIRDASARGRKLAAAGAVRLELGDFERGRAELDESRAVCGENKEPVGAVEAELGLAELFLLRGDAGRARSILAAPELRSFVSRSRLLVTRHRQLLASALLALGNPAGARQAAEEATRIAFTAGMNGEVIHGRARLGIALAELGRPGEAVVASRRATDLLVDLGGARRAEEVWFLQARIMARAGMAERSSRALEQARLEVERKRGLIADPTSQEMYEAHPLVVAITAG
ncbi:MAG: protein kinase, partial [Deltaproteobacteria bacterium]|nr:protein kinase [Deltaproteobacteria bacterium]